MAFVEKSYLSERATLTTNGFVVTDATEGFFVRFTTQDLAETAGAGMMFRAVSASGLPLVWSAHPTIPNLNLVSFNPIPQGNTAAIVDCRYVNVQPQVVLRGGCGLTSVLTDVDRNGNPVVVSNQNASATPPVSASQRNELGCHFNVLTPEATLVVQRIRPSLAFGGIDPVAQQDTYVGTVNSTAFLGIAPGRVLCENIGYDNDNLAGVAWRMQYEFRISRRTWYPRVVWIDPNTGSPGTQLVKAAGYDAGTPSNPSDASVGRKVVDSYEGKDFSALLT